MKKKWKTSVSIRILVKKIFLKKLKKNLASLKGPHNQID